MGVMGSSSVGTAGGGTCSSSSSSTTASLGGGILNFGDFSAGLAGRLQQSGIVSLVLLPDLEGVGIAVLDIAIRSPGEAAALGIASDRLDILQVTRGTLAEEDSHRLNGVSFVMIQHQRRCVLPHQQWHQSM